MPLAPDRDFGSPPHVRSPPAVRASKTYRPLCPDRLFDGLEILAPQIRCDRCCCEIMSPAARSCAVGKTKHLWNPGVCLGVYVTPPFQLADRHTLLIRSTNDPGGRWYVGHTANIAGTVSPVGPRAAVLLVQAEHRPVANASRLPTQRKWSKCACVCRMLTTVRPGWTSPRMRVQAHRQDRPPPPAW